MKFVQEATKRGRLPMTGIGSGSMGTAPDGNFRVQFDDYHFAASCHPRVDL
jgi:hypothetical protein